MPGSDEVVFDSRPPALELPTEEPNSIEVAHAAITIHAPNEEAQRKKKRWNEVGDTDQSVGKALRAFHREAKARKPATGCDSTGVAAGYVKGGDLDFRRQGTIAAPLISMRPCVA